MMDYMSSLRVSWDNLKRNDICIMDVPEGDKQDTDTENLPKEIMAVNHLNLESEADIH